MLQIGHSTNLGSNRVPTLMFLAQAVSDTNREVARSATGGLRNFTDHGDIAIPPLVNSLASSDSGQRLEAVLSLAAFGKEAHAGVPALVAALNDPDKIIRQEATNALIKIAPEVLETNGVSGVHE